MKLELTSDVLKKIVELVRQGVPLGVAAEATGVPAKRSFKWKSRGSKEESGIYQAFYAAVEQAKNERRAELIKTLVQPSIDKPTSIPAAKRALATIESQEKAQHAAKMHKLARDREVAQINLIKAQTDRVRSGLDEVDPLALTQKILDLVKQSSIGSAAATTTGASTGDPQQPDPSGTKGH